MKKLIPLILLVSCAHHKDVRPSADGTHKVIFQFENNNGAYQQAKSQADDYCEKEESKKAYIGKELYQYTGDIDEETYKQAKMASKVAQGVGGAGVVLGGKKEKNAGAVVSVGGSIARGVLGDGYKYTMEFVCK